MSTYMYHAHSSSLHRSGEPLPVNSSAHYMVTGEGSRVYSTGATMLSVALPITPSGLVNNSLKYTIPFPFWMVSQQILKPCLLMAEYVIYLYLFSRIWDIECGACLKLLEGHDDLVR